MSNKNSIRNNTGLRKKATSIAIVMAASGFAAEAVAQDWYVDPIKTFCTSNGRSLKTSSVSATTYGAYTPNPITFDMLALPLTTADSNGNSTACAVCHASPDELAKGTQKKNTTNVAGTISWVRAEKTAYSDAVTAAGGTLTSNPPPTNTDFSAFCALVSPTPTPTPTATATPTPTATATPTPTPTTAPTPTPTPTTGPTPTPTPNGSPTPTPTPNGSPTPTPTPHGSPSPTPTPSGSPAPKDPNQDKNDKPVINKSEASADVVVGQTLTLPIEAYDPEDDTILIKAFGKPKGSSLSPETAADQNGSATLTWTPTDKQANRKYKVKFRAEETKDNDSRPHLKSDKVTTEIRVFAKGSEDSYNLGINKAQWRKSKSEVVVSGKITTWKLLNEEEKGHLQEHATLTVNGTPGAFGNNGNWSATLSGLTETTVPCEVTATLKVHDATVESLPRTVKRAPSTCTK